MGDSQAVLGPRLGRLHAFRDRGSIYVDGVRTSAQDAILMAGVAKGADFTGTTWAVASGLALFVALEAAKLLFGYLDYTFHVMQEHQRMVSENNPVTMRQLAALEKLAR